MMRTIQLFSAVDKSKSVYISESDFPELEPDIFDVDHINIYRLKKTIITSVSPLSLYKLDVIGFKKNKDDYSYDIIVFDDAFQIIKYQIQLTSEDFKIMKTVSDIYGNKAYVYIVSDNNIHNSITKGINLFDPSDLSINICTTIYRLTNEKFIPCKYVV